MSCKVSVKGKSGVGVLSKAWHGAEVEVRDRSEWLTGKGELFIFLASSQRGLYLYKQISD